MDYDLHIGHPGDALNLLDQLLENDLDQEIVRVLMAIKDALERGII